MKKMHLYISFCILVILISIVYVGYYLTLFHTSKLNIKIEELSPLNEETSINKIENGSLFSKIQIIIKKNEDNRKDYMNFANGPGTGFYINYDIIIEKQEKKYKIKTMLKENTEEEIVLEGYVKTKFLQKGPYKIAILQHDYHQQSNEELLRYGVIEQIGEKSE